jgi:hypothetical protein
VSEKSFSGNDTEHSACHPELDPESLNLILSLSKEAFGMTQNDYQSILYQHAIMPDAGCWRVLQEKAFIAEEYQHLLLP